MSTIVAAEALTEDTRFNTPYDGEVPSDRYVGNTRVLGSREASRGSTFGQSDPTGAPVARF